MTIGKALLETWKRERAADSQHSKVAPLEYYLRYNYNERYVKLCERIGILPTTFGQWLRKDVETVK